MFDFLKKKIKDFVGTISRKEEKALEEETKESEKAAKFEEVNPPIINNAPQMERGTFEQDQPLIHQVDSTLEEIATTKALEEIETQKPYELGKPQGKEEAKIEALPKIEMEIESKIIEKEILKQEKEERFEIENAKLAQPKQPQRIARDFQEKPNEPGSFAKIEEIHAAKKTEKFELPLQKETETEEKEIEELVGETIEGNHRKDAKIAEKIIHENKAKEEISRKVFSGEREEFLAAGKDRDLKPKIGIFQQLKGFFTGDIEIKESDTKELFDQFELALMESDVSYQTSQALVSDLKLRLIGKKVRSGKIQEEVKREIAFALASIFQTSKSSFYAKVNESKTNSSLPFIVLFLGPNGMGKTTTIAKIAHNLKKRGITSVISASDTFRAAAIEQSVIHGQNLGIKIVKHNYGSDPAAVAFDAINFAKSHNIDVVLIDTAGRQDTNVNLLMEMQKIVRVVKPDLKVFIAEAIAGSSLVNQVKTFNEKLGLDGIVLTKLDCDAKGGGSLSIAYECKLPVYFVGVGQGYDDLLEFNEEWIIKNIMAE